MKRIVSIMIIVTMVMSVGINSFADTSGHEAEKWTDVTEEIMRDLVERATELYNDVKKEHWFIAYVARLTQLGAIKGYPDGSFRPDGNVKKGEFTKMLVGALGHELENADNGHWSSNYINKAFELGFLKEEDQEIFSKDQLNENITRAEAAKMAALASDEDETVSKVFKDKIKDYDSIEKSYQPYILNSFKAGIITGYEDGSFRPKGNLTRAEASAIIIRVIDEGERKIPEINQETKHDSDSVIKTIRDKYKDDLNEDASSFVEYKQCYKFMLSHGKLSDYKIVFKDKGEYTKILKDTLKMIYPNSHIKIYDTVLDTLTKTKDAPDIKKYYDGRYTNIARLKDGILILVGKKDVKWE